MIEITPTLKLFISKNNDSNGIHINSFNIKHNGNNYHLFASTKDTIYIFQESIALYILNMKLINYLY